MKQSGAIARRVTATRQLEEVVELPSLQPLFDRVLRGVRRQGYVRSTSAREACCYRGDHGMRCFVGFLLPDSVYRSDMEGSTVTMLAERGVFAGLPDEGIEFLADLQAVHDDEPPETWEDALATLADVYGLDYKPPTR
jgi:hypothetical protein